MNYWKRGKKHERVVLGYRPGNYTNGLTKDEAAWLASFCDAFGLLPAHYINAIELCASGKRMSEVAPIVKKSNERIRQVIMRAVKLARRKTRVISARL